MRNTISGAIAGLTVGILAGIFGVSIWFALACMVIGTINGVIIEGGRK